MNDPISAHHEFHLEKLRSEWGEKSYQNYIRALLAGDCSRLDSGRDAYLFELDTRERRVVEAIANQFLPMFFDDKFWKAKCATVLSHIEKQLAKNLKPVDGEVPESTLYAAFQGIALDVARVMRDNEQVRIRSGVEPAWMSQVFGWGFAIVIAVLCYLFIFK